MAAPKGWHGKRRRLGLPVMRMAGVVSVPASSLASQLPQVRRKPEIALYLYQTIKYSTDL